MKFKIKQMCLVLLVSDLDRAIEFYTKELGFDLDFRYEDFYAGIVKDGCSIHLKVGNTSPDETLRKKENEDVDIIISVENIEELFKEFNSKSVEIVQPLRTMPYGQEFYLADIDGNLISFLQNE